MSSSDQSAQNENSEHIEETSENLTEINISDEIVQEVASEVIGYK